MFFLFFLLFSGNLLAASAPFSEVVFVKEGGASSDSHDPYQYCPRELSPQLSARVATVKGGGLCISCRNSFFFDERWRL